MLPTVHEMTGDYLLVVGTSRGSGACRLRVEIHTGREMLADGLIAGGARPETPRLAKGGWPHSRRAFRQLIGGSRRAVQQSLDRISVDSINQPSASAFDIRTESCAPQQQVPHRRRVPLLGHAAPGLCWFFRNPPPMLPI